MDPKYITRSYTLPRTPGSFGGVSTFGEGRKIKDLKRLRKVLSGVDAYTLHFPVRRHHTTIPILSSYIGDVTSSDLMDVSNISRYNSGKHFILIFNDVLSKKTYFEAIKTKSSKDVAEAFKLIFKRFKYKINKMLVDEGKEWMGHVNVLFKKIGIHKYHVKSIYKASPSENRVKWLRIKLERYFTHNNTQKYTDVLLDFEKSYNSSYNKVIDSTPDMVNLKTQDLAWFNGYKKFIYRKEQTNLFSVGQRVRVNRYRELFVKSSKASFSREIFLIREIKKSFGVYYYLLNDTTGTPIPGKYYKTEIVAVDDNGNI